MTGRGTSQSPDHHHYDGPREDNGGHDIDGPRDDDGDEDALDETTIALVR